MHPVYDELDHPVLAELRVRKGRVILFAVSILALSLLLCSCAAGRTLRPEPMKGVPEPAGQYTLYLYHSKEADSPEGNYIVEGAVAILDREGDGYEFDLHAPDYSYTVFNGMSGHDAAELAIVYLSKFRGGRVYSSISIEGETVGYEMRLAHPTWIYAKESVGAKYYLAEEGKVRVEFLMQRYIPDRKKL